MITTILFIISNIVLVAYIATKVHTNKRISPYAELVSFKIIALIWLFFFLPITMQKLLVFITQPMSLLVLIALTYSITFTFCVNLYRKNQVLQNDLTKIVREIAIRDEKKSKKK